MCNILFLGTPDFALLTLKSLLNKNYNILAVFSQPPSKSKRGQRTQKSAVQVFSEDHKLNIRTPLKIELEENYIKKLDADLGVVVAYGQIIPEKILSLTKYGFINIHASLLPKYRGSAPIQRSIINEDSSTGISIMKINKNLDSGPICNQYKINIKPDENYLSLSKRLSELGAEKIIENINLITSGKIVFKEQNHSLATYTKKISKSEGKINWNQDAKKIIAKKNGLSPHPGIWFGFDGERYKIIEAEFSILNGEPGKVLDNALTIGCGKNSIKVKVLQRQGKKPQKIDEFLRGSRIKVGSQLIYE